MSVTLSTSFVKIFFSENSVSANSSVPFLTLFVRDFVLDNSVSANYSIPFSESFVDDFFSSNSVVLTPSFLSPNALLTLSFDDIIDYPLTFLSNIVDSRHRLITLIVLLKYNALLASDVVKFILNTTRSGMVKLLTLIGYSSGLHDMAESIRNKNE